MRQLSNWFTNERVVGAVVVVVVVVVVVLVVVLVGVVVVVVVAVVEVVVVVAKVYLGFLVRMELIHTLVIAIAVIHDAT
jgi:hypothetical protein